MANGRPRNTITIGGAKSELRERQGGLGFDDAPAALAKVECARYDPRRSCGAMSKVSPRERPK